MPQQELGGGADEADGDQAADLDVVAAAPRPAAHHVHGGEHHEAHEEGGLLD